MCFYVFVQVHVIHTSMCTKGVGSVELELQGRWELGTELGSLKEPSSPLSQTSAFGVCIGYLLGTT